MPLAPDIDLQGLQPTPVQVRPVRGKVCFKAVQHAVLGQKPREVIAANTVAQGCEIIGNALCYGRGSNLRLWSWLTWLVPLPE